MMFSGFRSFFDSFFRSELMEDLRLKKFLLFDLILDKSFPTSQIFFIRVSVSMKLSVLIASFES